MQNIALPAVALGIVALCLIYVRIVADEAEETGELRWRWALFKRSDDPKAFDRQIMYLRATPWFAAAGLALLALIIGLTV